MRVVRRRPPRPAATALVAIAVAALCFWLGYTVMRYLGGLAGGP